VLVEVCSPDVVHACKSLQQHLKVLDACFDFYVYLLDICITMVAYVLAQRKIGKSWVCM